MSKAMPPKISTNHLPPHYTESLDSPGWSSAADSEAMKDFKSQILSALQPSAVDGQRFLPADKVEELTTREIVEAELAEADIEEDCIDALTEFVIKRAKRVFLMLAYSESVQALPALYEDGFCDEHLPIGLRRSEQKTAPVQPAEGVSSGLERHKPGKKIRKGQFHYIVGPLNESTNTLKPLRWAAFSQWKNRDLEHFESGQWYFLSQIFVKEQFFYRFNSKRPLPFLSKKNFPDKTGFFSRVYQVEIHPAHQREVVNGGKLLVAVKELLPGMEAYYQKESDTLAVIRGLNHPNLIKPIATYQRGEAHCFMFPWADGDNLRKFWREADKPSQGHLPPDPDLVLWVLEQMRGLADGLHVLYDKNCRHGDLKPENILRFTQKHGRGKLLIADMGLAKFHIVATQQRAAQSSTSEGTFRYAPPEVDYKESDKPLSRAYDVWSMGCIYLEFLIWLVGGQPYLQTFNKAGSGSFDKFWEFIENGEKYQVHRAISRWIEVLSERLHCDDERVDTALKSILQLVKTRLLVVKLEGAGVPEEEGRAKANELLERVAAIHDRAKNDPTYLLDASLWRQARPSATSPSSLVPPKRVDLPHGFATTLRPARSLTLDKNADVQVTVQLAPNDDIVQLSTSRQSVQEQLSKLNDVWESSADNGFARQLFGQINWPSLRPSSSGAKLCSQCDDLDLWSPGFKITRKHSDLLERRESCSVCNLLYQTISHNQSTKNQDHSQFLRVESSFRTEFNGLPVVSIYADPESEESPSFAQLGFPLLPEQGSRTQFTLLREWLRICDETHDCQTQQAKEGKNALPTRVIDVGDQTTPQLRLLDGNLRRQGRYVALSHRWGKLDEADKYCTYKHNITAFREGMHFDDLPQTFKDAVKVTRGLNIQFLWIDSLCIIQDDAKDWEAESERMEDVFSSAYCTIAASSANSSLEGFLQTRRQRECVTLRSPKLGTLYLCKAIDNFQKDVEQGELNKRGWVLQERALSRRSIHFTSNQVYWECGKDVHCETLAKLHNSMAAFLGDADFPKSALGYFKGGRIVLFQRLYEMYSRLAFTKEQDRSVAISGLEKRLVRDFKTRGGYGVFDVYLARGLLWQRPEGGTLTRICYPTDLHVPSWSWMAYNGPIGYMTIPFSGADWTDDFKSPFNSDTSEESKKYWRRCDCTGTMDLVALARAMIRLDQVEMLKRIRFDESTDMDTESLRCVVIGKEKQEGGSRDPMHYVLVIKPLALGGSTGDYERVGAGYLQAVHISETGAWVRIR